MRYIIVLFSITSLLLLHSCSKFEDLEKQMDASVDMSAVAVFNIVPNSTAMEISLGESKINKVNERLAFGDYLSYRTQFSGKKTIRIVSGKDTYEGSVDLFPQRFYSIFVNKEGGKLTVVQSEDDMILPAKGNAKIRVAHMSYDAASFTFGEGGNQLLSNIKYKDVTGFKEIKSSERQTLLIVKPTTAVGNTRSLEQVFIPKDQGIYTLLIKGYVNASNETEEISMQLVKH